MGLVRHTDYQYQRLRVNKADGPGTRIAAPDPASLQGAQNAQICTASILIAIKAELVQNGGSTRVREEQD